MSPRAEHALREAMERLLSGKSRHTDGRLIKDNLWKEAQVSRATMNRATALLREWDARLAQSGARTPGESRRDAELAELRRRLRELSQENKALGRRLDAAATVIAALHADNIALSEKADRRGTVTSIGSQPARAR
ncbi:hypothetical protein ACFV4M_02050 [Kitasatospora indigofera]|uniref:hypothetical protein n=1 Tax=Kitasatospora indigofera TaxID=67307 RepID=UPI00364642C2